MMFESMRALRNIPVDAGGRTLVPDIRLREFVDKLVAARIVVELWLWGNGTGLVNLGGACDILVGSPSGIVLWLCIVREGRGVGVRNRRDRLGIVPVGRRALCPIASRGNGAGAILGPCLLISYKCING